ncbi:hypothetical protein ABBQ38_004847 [Trebouxia sp. C0009 RCD-2024]
MASPTFAPSALKKQLTPLFKTATPFKPSRLGPLEAHQASTITPSPASLTVTRTEFKTLTPIQLQSSVTKPSISSSSPSCGGSGTCTINDMSPKSLLASAIRSASVKSSPANRPPWSFAAPHSPAVSAAVSSPVSHVRSTLVRSATVSAPDVRESSTAEQARTVTMRQLHRHPVPALVWSPGPAPWPRPPPQLAAAHQAVQLQQGQAGIVPPPQLAAQPT